MKKSLLILTAIAIFFASCRKDRDQIQPTPPGNGTPVNPVSGMKLMKKSDIWIGDLNFEYNSDSTLKKIFYTVNGLNHVSDFSYAAGRVMREGKTNGVIIERDTMFLENGRGTKLVRSFFSNGDPNPYSKDTTTYEFNNGILSRINYKFGVYTIYTYNNEGDLINRTTYNAQNQVKYKYEYQYFPQLEKNPFYNQMQGNWYARYLSPISKHVLKSYKNTDFEIPSTNEYMYTHEYDPDGYVIKSTWWNVVNPGVTYTSQIVY